MLSVSYTSQCARSGMITLRPGVNQRSDRRAQQCRGASCGSSASFSAILTAWNAPVRGGAAQLLQDALPAPPTTSRAFASNETLVLFAEVYENNDRVRRDPSYTIHVTARLYDAAGDVVRLVSDQRDSLATRRPSGGHGFTLRLPLDAARSGDYVLQVEARSTRDVTHRAEKLIPLRVQ